MGEHGEPVISNTPGPGGVASITVVAPSGNVVGSDANPLGIPSPRPTATPYVVPPNLERVPVKSIEMEFRPVAGADNMQSIGTGTSVHGFLVVERTNGFKHVLALDPIPAGAAMSGHAQATFVAGSESKHDIDEPVRRYDLHPPKYPGLSPEAARTRYGNELIAGARAYNEHPVRYDVPASEGFNSNSWAGSLVIAKGGEAGLRDIEHIARELDGKMPLLHEGTTAPWKPGDDQREMQHVAEATRAGQPIAPGLHNSTIPHDRFSSGRPTDLAAQYPPPPGVHSGLIGTLNANPDVLGRNLGSYLRAEFDHASHAAASPSAAAPEPAPVPAPALERVPGAPLHVRYAGVDREFLAGRYQQSGKIIEVNGDSVVQNIGRGTAVYRLSELTATSSDPGRVEKSLIDAHTHSQSIDIRYDPSGTLEITRADLGARTLGQEIGHHR
jgi:hypothetical protein